MNKLNADLMHKGLLICRSRWMLLKNSQPFSFSEDFGQLEISISKKEVFKCINRLSWQLVVFMLKCDPVCSFNKSSRIFIAPYFPNNSGQPFFGAKVKIKNIPTASHCHKILIKHIKFYGK